MVAEKGHARSGLKAASANQKADAAFCGPLRLITKRKQPFVSRCSPLQNRSGSTMATSAHHKAQAVRQKIKVTLVTTFIFIITISTPVITLLNLDF